MGFMSTPAHRGRAITFVFMGWSVASVAGMPMAAWVGERLGWRIAMGMVAAGALCVAWLVWRHVPGASVRPRCRGARGARCLPRRC